MMLTSYLLYLMMAAILLWMWRRVRGMTLEEIVQASANEHHELNAVFETHPRGGSWPELCGWLEKRSESEQMQRDP